MTGPITEPSGVDAIVRFHDVRRLRELERAIFSLVAQELRPLHIILVLQRFTNDQAGKVRAALAPLLSLTRAPDLTVLTYNEPEPSDARSFLINLGLGAATARYLALLDYDDLMYPEAYRLLTERLRESGAGIAFGGISVKRVDVYQDFLRPFSKIPRFSGGSLPDLFRSNFCPIHSFVVDRTRVPAEELRFEPMQTIEEDYEFLLRVCARTPSDFSLIGTQLGEYYYKTDHSNTLAGAVDLPPDLRARADAGIAFNEARRRLTPLSRAVQRQLGLPAYRPGLTIRNFLDECTADAGTQG